MCKKVRICLFTFCLKMKAVLWVFFAITVERFDRFSGGLDFSYILIDRANRDICFDLRVSHFVFVCVSVCLSYVYGYSCLPFSMEFGINVHHTKVERSMCKDFHFPLVSKWQLFCWLFCSYGRRARDTVHRNTTSMKSHISTNPLQNPQTQ